MDGTHSSTASPQPDSPLDEIELEVETTGVFAAEVVDCAVAYEAAVARRMADV